MKNLKEKAQSLIKFCLISLPFFIFISLFICTLLIGLSQQKIEINNFIPSFWVSLKTNILTIFICVLVSICLYAIVVVGMCLFFQRRGLYVRTAWTDEHGGAKWIVDEENYPYNGTMLKKFNQTYPISTNNNDGVPSWVVRAKKVSNKVIYNTRTNTQALCLGATGSGKTQKIIIPSAIYNANLSLDQQPCMIFTDPKGELCEKLGNILIDKGYDVLVLNLRKPNYSSGWNPLSIAYKYYYDSINFEESSIKSITTKDEEVIENFIKKMACFIHAKVKCEECANSITKTQDGYKIWILKGESWLFEESRVERIIKLNTLELKAAAYEEIENLITVLFPLPKTDNPVWTINAGRMTAAIIYALLEIMEVEPDELPVEKFNLTTVAQILSNQKKIVEWFKILGVANPNSKAYMTASPIINSAEVTRQGIFSNITPALKIFEDLGIQNITCRNDIDLFKFTEKPKALFLIIPDEKTNRHILGSLFISQMYTASVFVANENKGILPRAIQFYLDEFGNMPVINDFDSYITVARSRKMFFMLVLQDFKQLFEKYGPQKGATIKNNCNLNIYIQTNDQETAEAYSKIIGDYTVIARTRNAGFKLQDQLGGNLSQTGIPLIKSSDLMRLKDPYGVVIYAKEQPAKIYMEYSYKLPSFKSEPFNVISKDKIKVIDFYQDHYFDLLSFEIDLPFDDDDID